MEIIDQRSWVISKATSFINNLEGGVFIMGTNKYGLSIKKWLKERNISVYGFINDYSQEPNFEDTPVIHSKIIKRDQSLINCVIEGRTIDAQDKLLSLQPIQVIDYFALQLAFPDDLIQIDFLEDTDSILTDLHHYKHLYNQLEDEESKETLVKLLNFRLNRNIENLRGFKFKIKEQYFEPFISLKDQPVFIDGGGFDGETTLNFRKLYPEYSSVFFFEPNQKIIPDAKINLEGFVNLNFFEKGLWSKTEILKFDGSKSGASKVTEDGNITIAAVALDDIIKLNNIDFIKFDIEGAELEAIKGTKSIIQEKRPNLAVCVYHAQKDFLTIPQLVNSYRDDYKIYLRHYTQGVFETVMFFV